MGANSTQAQVVVLFLVAFICIAGGLAANVNFLLVVLGLVLLGASGALFIKCKPWEQKEG